MKMRDLIDIMENHDAVDANPLDQMVTLRQDGRVIGHMTVGEFFENNSDGIDEDEQRDIIRVLAARGRYRGGGGASPEWSLFCD